MASSKEVSELKVRGLNAPLCFVQYGGLRVDASQAKSEATEKQLVVAQEELSNVSKKLESLQSKYDENDEALTIAMSELSHAKQEGNITC